MGEATNLIIFLGLIFAVFYFLIIRPQRRRQRNHQDLVMDLNKGDKVITIGGLFGEIDTVGEHDLIILTEDGSKMKFLKNSIMSKQHQPETS